MDAGGEGESSVTVTITCPVAIPEVNAKWTSYLCAFNIAEVLILELMPGQHVSDALLMSSAAFSISAVSRSALMLQYLISQLVDTAQ